MKLEKIIIEIEKIFPLKTAEDFDNVGLLLGKAHVDCNKALICHDVTDEIIDEALNIKCELIISYHPLIFNNLKKINYEDRIGRIITKMIENKLSLYSIHTSFDNLKNGLNFELGKILNLKNQKKLIPKINTLMKITSYVPSDYLDEVLNSLYKAGAGEIDNYSKCSFSAKGEGRYLGSKESNPKFGNKEELTKASEIFISLVFPSYKMKKVIENLTKSHPYESVAYEITNIENENPDLGLGSIGFLPRSMNEKEFLEYLKNKLPINVIRHSKFRENQIKIVAVLAGSGAFAIDNAIKNKADAFVTGDLKYHDFFKDDNKILLVDAGHFETEFFIKNKLQEILKEKIPSFAFVLSEINNNPIKYF
ncbi:MAG: Nif3-like dinuclear metal center hexameric protein [Flavobacteriaceae bacterium]